MKRKIGYLKSDLRTELKKEGSTKEVSEGIRSPSDGARVLQTVHNSM